MRLDSGFAMNTMAMCDFDKPRDKKYGEADKVQVRTLRGTRDRGHTMRHFRGPQDRDACETRGQHGKFEPFWTKNWGVFERGCPGIVVRVQRNGGGTGCAVCRRLDTTGWGERGRGNVRRSVVCSLCLQLRWASSVHNTFLRGISKHPPRADYLHATIARGR